MRRPATRRIHLPAHPPTGRPALPACYLPAGWCISPAVPPHPAGVALRTPVREHDLRQMSVAVIAVTRTVTLASVSALSSRVRSSPKMHTVCEARTVVWRISCPSSFLRVFISPPRASVIRTTAVPVAPVYAVALHGSLCFCRLRSCTHNATPPRWHPPPFRQVPHRMPLRLLQPGPAGHCVSIGWPETVARRKRHLPPCASVIPSSNRSSHHSSSGKWSSAAASSPVRPSPGPAHPTSDGSAYAPNYPSRTANVLPDSIQSVLLAAVRMMARHPPPHRPAFKPPGT